MFFNFEVKYVKDFWSHWHKTFFGGTLHILELSQKIYLRITDFLTRKWILFDFDTLLKVRRNTSKNDPKMAPFSWLVSALGLIFFQKMGFRKTTICRDLFGHKQSPKKFWHQKNASSSQKSKHKTVFLKTRLKIRYFFRDFSFRLESFGFIRGWKIGGWWKNQNSEKYPSSNRLKLCQQKLMWKN